jgi:TolB-like protein/cytochrome c-type biogenesis protein CcmH/NrfG
MERERMAPFLQPLKERKLIQWGIAYLAGAWFVVEATGLVVDQFTWPVLVGQVVTILAFFGFFVVLVLAWYHGEKGRQRVSGPELLMIALLLLLSGGVLSIMSGPGESQESIGVGVRTAFEDGKPSIAVLPFVNMSDDASNEYFSDGISEELLNLLAKIPDLHVAARTSSFSFKGQSLEVTEIAERLNVAHVLEGSVRKADVEVRITAQLIRAEDGLHVWSETWDRTLQDVFAIQDEIAADVTEQLKVTLLGAAPTAERVDPAAYALFLQARHLMGQRSSEAYERSFALYEQALSIEPEYTAAWVGLGDNYSAQAGSGFRPIDEGNRLACEAANRALSIDPDYAEAYALLSSIADVYENDLAAPARHLEHALELDPTNTKILYSAAFLASSLGRLDQAIALLEYVVARDPVNPGGHANLGVFYLFAGRLDESIASRRTAQSLSPGRENATMLIGWALLEKGEPEEALAAMQEEPSEIWRMAGLAGAYHALGQSAESDAALATLMGVTRTALPST